MQSLLSSVQGKLDVWHVAVGDVVRAGQPVARVAGRDVQVHAAGRVFYLSVPVGGEVKSDSPLLYVQAEMAVAMTEPVKSSGVSLHSLHISDEFWDWLVQYSDEISRDYNYSRAEICRAALEQFRNATPEVRLKTLERNRRREIAGRYGAGKYPSRRVSSLRKRSS